MPEPVAVVVGVGPGLGWAVAQRFASAGMRVVVAARTREKLDTLISRADESVAPASRYEAHACDATRVDDVTRLFARFSKGDAPAVVVFNAGAFVPAGILDIAPEEFERCWRVGCLGGFLIGQAAARLMAEKGEGTIVFTGATASLRGSAGFANLAVPKFGLRALAQSMARELGPRNVHVAHVIIDGQIESGRGGAERAPDSRLAPDAIAETYFQLYRQPRSAWTHELDLRPWSEKF